MVSHFFLCSPTDLYWSHSAYEKFSVSKENCLFLLTYFTYFKKPKKKIHKALKIEREKGRWEKKKQKEKRKEGLRKKKKRKCSNKCDYWGAETWTSSLFLIQVH